VCTGSTVAILRGIGQVSSEGENFVIVHIDKDACYLWPRLGLCYYT
jgi:hypothetical protein